MGYDYNKTHSDLMESAKKLFLEEGFLQVSIRQICSGAGMTNGAFYAHFESKEDLFNKLVEPDLEGFYKAFIVNYGDYKGVNSIEDILEVFRRTFDSDRSAIHYIYEHADTFRLLLDSSDGTKYEDFLNKLTEIEHKRTVCFFEKCRPYVKNPENMTENIIMQNCYVLVFSAFLCFQKGLSEEETVREVFLATEFCIAGLRGILGI